VDYFSTIIFPKDVSTEIKTTQVTSEKYS